MGYHLYLETIEQHPHLLTLLNKLINNPEGITDEQWQLLSELHYHQFLRRELPEHESMWGQQYEIYPEDINLAEFLCITGLIKSLDTLQTRAPKLLQDMMTPNRVEVLKVFLCTAQNGHLEAVKRVEKYLEEKAPSFLPLMTLNVGTHKYVALEAFALAAENGHLDVMKHLEEKYFERIGSVPEGVIEIYYCAAYSMAARNGQIEAMKLLENKRPSLLKSMLKPQETAFREAAKNGQIGVMTHLKETLTDSLEDMIRASDNEERLNAFELAAKNGQLEVIKHLEKMAPDLIQAMKQDYNSKAFGAAADNGRLEVVKYLIDDVPKLNTSYGLWVFTSAGQKGQLEIVKYLAEKEPTLLSFGIEIFRDGRGAFRYGTEGQKFLRVQEWLLQYPTCLAYAEAHVYEYSEIVNPFIERTLLSIHQEQDAYLHENPNGEFDLQDPVRATHCFYIIRNLIRRNDRALDDEIRFLLTIPRVKALAQDESNELLRLGLSVGNQQAARMLLNIPAVRHLAEENNYYREEARSGVDARHLAQDCESSMIALTEGESKRVKDAIAKYQPMIKTTGINNIMQGLRDNLVELYQKNPAKITINSEEITLPVDYQELQDLTLNPTDYERALKAYYKNPAHTALRYLSKPNHWMHPNASYVYIDPETMGRWSTFEEYQPLIAMYYLAAVDKDTPPTEGYSFETRLEHFVNELALIGRAHNWDKAIIGENGQRREIDDEKGDKPSCYSGVNRRLSQSLRGHPLFDIQDDANLTSEMIDKELRQFAFGPIESTSKSNIEALWNIFEKMAEEPELILDDSEKETLLSFNISEEAQNEFISYLGNKYGAQFSDIFLKQVQDALSIAPESENPYNRYHILKHQLFNAYEMENYLSRVHEVQSHNQEPEQEPIVTSSLSPSQDMVVEDLIENDIAEPEPEPKAAPSPSPAQDPNLISPALNKAYAQNLETFKLLLKVGANPNSYYFPETKETLLHRACKDNNIEYVKAMLDTGKVTFTQNSAGKYPIDIARQNSSDGVFGIYGFMSSGPAIAKEIVKLITDYAAKPQDELGYRGLGSSK